MKPLTLFLVLLFFFPLLHGSPSDFLNTFKGLEEKELLQKGVTLDLRDPLYSEGLLKTEKGGVIDAEGIRIQALTLSYQRSDETWSVEAEGDLFILFGDYLFRGEKLYYDFKKKEGFIEKGVSALEPWFFGGERVDLRSDGSLILYNGYATTSERDLPEWGIFSEALLVENEENLEAKKIEIRFHNYSILWIPSLKVNLNSIFDSPLKYRFRWGGRQGPRFGVGYELFSWNGWKTFLRFDYRLTRGPGGGIETYFHTPDRKMEFQMINYLAKDSSILKIKEKARYRFEGSFRKIFEDDKTTLLLTYDKISDIDMPNCYYDQDFFIQTAYRTQFLLRRQEKDWISTFYSRVRINSFETVKQELPTFRLNFKPKPIASSGIIFQNWAAVSYLDFKYSKNLYYYENYASSRFYFQPLLYRPFSFGSLFTLTPEVGGTGIIYGNSPKKVKECLALGKVGFKLHSRLYRVYGTMKHVIEPYFAYTYYSGPTINPHKHFIFDIYDGLDRLNYCTIGCKNSCFKKNCTGELSKPFQANFYAYLFFDTKKMKSKIPRLYGDFTFDWTPTFRQVITSAWSVERNEVDHFNLLTAWTLSEECAFSAEYRHRNAYSWRKVDPTNFFLDVFRSEKRLRHSLVSDRRDTILFHLFYRFHPEWACEVTSRQGWNRRHRQPDYLEYEIDLLTTIQTAWQVRLSFQHQENDNRVAVYVNVGIKRPDSANLDYATPFYD